MKWGSLVTHLITSTMQSGDRLDAGIHVPSSAALAAIIQASMDMMDRL